MQQSSEYRLYIYDRLNVEEGIKSELRCLSCNIRRDLLGSETSTFTVVDVKNAVNIGDILECRDSFGTMIYQGVIERIENNIIDTGQIVSLFNDNWLYRKYPSNSIEEELANIIKRDFTNSDDPIVHETFNNYEISLLSKSTSLALLSESIDYVVNFENLIYKLYRDYYIQFNFEFNFNGGNPKLEIGIPNYEKHVMINNTTMIRNVDVLKETFETNKLIVYSQETGEFVGTYFTSEIGITDDPSELTRLNVVKTNIVFSDDPISLIKAQNLRNNIYNHQIEFDLQIIGNQLYDFWDMKLGQKVDLFIDDKFFETIFTGYELMKPIDSNVNMAHLVFGLVRTDFTKRW